MDNYLLFVVIAAATVLSPGPGVILTLTNSIRSGVSGSVGGILGIAFGTLIVATVSATGLGLILTTSSLAFSIMKYVGAAYLIYLGVKLWRTPAQNITTDMAASKKKFSVQLLEGLMLQLTNPKAVFFFISIFPQFIDYSKANAVQFATLVITYSCLVVIIHFIYAYLAKSARIWLSTKNGGQLVNRFGGGTFMCFGVGLATASK